MFNRRKGDRPDVVILDINLPDASGLETFHRIHEIDPKIPVIFITGHGTMAQRVDCPQGWMSLGRSARYLTATLTKRRERRGTSRRSR